MQKSLLILKPLRKLEIDGSFLSVIKGTYEKPRANIFNVELPAIFTQDQEKCRDFHFPYMYSQVYQKFYTVLDKKKKD